MFALTGPTMTAELSPRREAFARGLLVLTDLTLATSIGVAPLILGGRHAAGRWFYAVLGLLALTTWLGRRIVAGSPGWRWTGGEWLIVAAITIVTCQIVPLPHGVLTALAPGLEGRLPLLMGTPPDTGSALGSWQTFSAAPHETAQSLALLVGLAALAVTITQRVRTVADVKGLFTLVATGTVIVAVVGVLQHLAGNGRFVWLFAEPDRDPSDVLKGPFINENHFAHALAIGLPPLVVLTVGRWSASLRRETAGWDRPASSFPWTTVVLLATVLLVTLAGVLSFSRAGAAAVLIALVGGAIAARPFVTDTRLRLGLIAVGGILAACITLYGAEELLTQTRSLLTEQVGEARSIAGRLGLWQADLAAVGEFPWFGTGVGTHVEIYPAYFASAPHDVTMRYAESGYIQIVTETGLLGATLAAVALGQVAIWCLTATGRATTPMARALAGAATVSVLVSVVHSVCDFVWWIPGCLVPTVAMIAGAAALARSARPGSSESPASRSPASVTSGSATAAAGAWASAGATPHGQRPGFRSSSATPSESHAAPSDGDLPWLGTILVETVSRRWTVGRRHLQPGPFRSRSSSRAHRATRRSSTPRVSRLASALERSIPRIVATSHDRHLGERLNQPPVDRSRTNASSDAVSPALKIPRSAVQARRTWRALTPTAGLALTVALLAVVGQTLWPPIGAEFAWTEYRLAMRATNADAPPDQSAIASDPEAGTVPGSEPPRDPSATDGANVTATTDPSESIATQADESLAALAAAETRERLGVRIAILERVVAADPGHADAHLSLAKLYLDRFRTSPAVVAMGMSLVHVRDVVISSEWDVDAGRAWIDRAMPGTIDDLDRAIEHATACVRLAPWNGDAYLTLSQVAFLDERLGTDRHLIVQALRVRPHDGNTLYVAASQAAAARQFAAAEALTRRAFRREPSVRDRILNDLSDSIPPATLIDYLQPDLDGLYRIHRRLAETPEGQRLARDAYLARLESLSHRSVGSAVVVARSDWEPVTATALYRGAELAAEAGQLDAAIAYLQHAVQISPDDHALHKRLASYLRQSQRFDEAEVELRWLLARFPGNRAISDQLADVTARRTAANTSGLTAPSRR